ncbi:response regulator [bacterium]|nr:response regulator [bacterium]MCP5462578.1 response regulator [bacterium]
MKPRSNPDNKQLFTNYILDLLPENMRFTSAEPDEEKFRTQDISPEFLQNYIHEIMQSSDKYMFLTNHANEVIFKYDVMDDTSNHMLQEIMRDINTPKNNRLIPDHSLRRIIYQRINEIFDSENKYRFLLEHLEVLVFTCDTNYNFTFLSSQWNKMLGYSKQESLNTCFLDYVHVNDIHIVREKMARLFSHSEKIMNLEYHIRDAQTQWKPHLLSATPILNMDGSPVGMLVVSRDIIEQKQLRQQMQSFNEQLEQKVRERTEEINSAYDELKKINTKLIQSEKMAGIGELCSGIAHEFNNIIGIIKAYAEFAQQHFTEKNFNKLIDAVLLSSNRATKITKSLLSFARRIEPQRELANINETIEEVLLLLETEFKKSNITVIPDLNRSISSNIYDIGQIEQVLLNLLVNAKHALENRNDDPKIIISSSETEDYIQVDVIDNGIGIKKENFDKIFQPFFSTKGAYGKSKLPGTGLGLSVSLGIIENHQGTLTVDSIENKGTTFTIRLPKRYKASPTNNIQKILHEKERAAKTEPIRKYKRSANILIVDDEEYLRNALCDILSVEGYTLIAAENGENALKLFNHTRFDLVLMDLMMPGIDGAETIKIMRSIRPDTKVIIVSGSSHAISDSSIEQNDIQGVIFKPFDIEELISKISYVLDKE